MDPRIEELLPFYALDALTDEERELVVDPLVALRIDEVVLAAGDVLGIDGDPAVEIEAVGDATRLLAGERERRDDVRLLGAGRAARGGGVLGRRRATARRGNEGDATRERGEGAESS